jgi:MFS family permease
MEMNLSLFKNKNFLFYWLAGWISSLGDGVFIIALTWMLVQTTGSSLIVGSYLFVLGVTKLVLIMFGGVVVDRMDNRKLLIFSDVARALLMFVFFMMGGHGAPPLWSFYVIGVLFGLVDSVNEPASIACRTRIVEEKFYTQSMGLLMIAGNVSVIIGPSLGALLVAYFSPLDAILLNGASFLVSAVLILLVHFKPVQHTEEPEKRESFFTGFKSGLNYFKSTPILLAMATFAFFSNAAVGTTEITIPFLAKSLHAGVQGFGLMNTSIGIGSVVGAIVFSLFVIKRPRPYMTLLTCFLQGIMLLLIGFTHNLWLLVALFILVGGHETAVNIIAPSVNHTLIPPHLFGRVISIMIIVMSGSIPLSQAVTGWLMTRVEPHRIFTFAGLLEMAVALITFSLPVVRSHGKAAGPAKGEAM